MTGDSPSANGPSTADNAAFVEHLRLVHFTLCITCLVAIIAVASQTPSSASRAYDQANDLIRLSNKWQDGPWLTDFAQKRGMARAHIPVAVAGPGAPTRDFRPSRGSASRRQFQFSWLALATDSKDGPVVLLVPHPFATLSDAEKVWNALNRVRYTIELSGVEGGWDIALDGSVSEIKLKQPGPALVEKNVDPSGSDFSQLFLRADLFSYLAEPGGRVLQRQAAQNLIKADGATCYLVVPYDREPATLLTLTIMRADCTSATIDLSAMFAATVLPSKIPPGDFAHSFPDADDLAKNLKTLSLDDLRQHFASEKDRAGDKIELLVKLPAEKVAYWGTAIIFGITIYWFSVLRDFALRARPDDKAWTVPWIGVSRETSSMSLFLATTFIPPLVVAYIVFQAPGQTMSSPMRLFFALLALVMVGLPMCGVVCSWRGIQRLQESATLVKPTHLSASLDEES